MKKKLFLLFALSVPPMAQSAWIDSNGKPITDTESMRSSGDFGVQLVLTPDDNQFRQTWNSTKGTPKLSSTNSVRLGSSIAAVLIFHGCSPSSVGVCDVVSEFVLESPDGAKTPAGGGSVWSSTPLQGGLLQLGHASMKVGFDRSDPAGTYKIIANVKDKISGRTLSLTSEFNATK